MPLPAAEAYRLWAPTYGSETAVSALDARLVDALSPPPAGRRLLDAGCGTGRRLADAGAATFRAGIDLVPEMLARAQVAPDPPGGRLYRRPSGASAIRAGGTSARPTHHGGARASEPHRLRLAAADVCCIPFRADTFDLVWCRLVLGHLPSLRAAYAELARVSRAGATVIVTDFHPAAAEAGHRRTFRTEGGEVSEVVHHLHTARDHCAAAEAAGLKLGLALEEAVGPVVLPLYAAAGKTERYLSDLGLPLVLGLRFYRSGGSSPQPKGC